MRRFVRVGVILIALGFFASLFFRVGWGKRQYNALGSIGPCTIVLREASGSRFADLELQDRLKREGRTELTEEEKEWLQQNEYRPSIKWPARATDVLGLTIAFSGVLVLIVGATRPRTQGAA